MIFVSGVRKCHGVGNLLCDMRPSRRYYLPFHTSAHTCNRFAVKCLSDGKMKNFQYSLSLRDVKVCDKVPCTNVLQHDASAAHGAHLFAIVVFCIDIHSVPKQEKSSSSVRDAMKDKVPCASAL